MSDENKLTLSGRKTLGVKTTVEAGKVRQSFSHGRSKNVLVEVKRKRILKKPGEAEAEPAPEVEVAVEPPPPAPPIDTTGLTANEINARQEAARIALQQAEEERRRNAEEARRREEAEKALESERERENREAKQRRAEQEQEQKQVADQETTVRAETRGPRKKQAPRPVIAEPLPPPDDESEEGRKRREAKLKRKADVVKPVRRDDERRRSGKLSVNMALGDGEEIRQRSLASLRRARAKEKRAQEMAQTGPKKAREVVVPEVITVQELANRMAEKAVDVIKVLMKMDVMATINQPLDQDTAELVVTEFGHIIKRVSDADVEIGVVGEQDDPTLLQPRPPVVTVMGHVDHGKTSLLDAIRQADVAAGEAGGITQHIGAYQVQVPSGQKITFIDTPGHEAFTAMRARGASVTDLVVLVVAADDGIKPQTVEAINHARAAEVPIIVAINKMDKPGADPDKVRQGLLQHEVIVESLSGEVLEIEVSALKRTNIDKLLEAINLQAELLEVSANPNRAAEGVVIEAELDKGRGPVGTVMVQRGTLKVGDIVVAGAEWGKVRALVDDRGQQVSEAGPSQPVEILGLNAAPAAGDLFSVVESEARAREITAYRKSELQKKRQIAAPASLESLFSAMKDAQVAEYPVVVKGDVQGSVEAIGAALARLGTDEIRVRVLHAAVGGITEYDVTLAKASNAAIIGFNVRANRQAREAAEQDGVPIKYYSIIYNLVDDIKAAMAGQLGPEIIETVLGRALVKDVFTAGKAGRAAGCQVSEGTIKKASKARVMRDDVIVYTGKINSLRRFKDDVEEVRNGLECGITLENFSDIKPGDIIESYSTEERERVL